MEMTHRQVILDLIAKRFENVLGDDAHNVLQILMELYCDAKALDQIAVENRPTVPAAPPAQHKPKKSKSGGVGHRQACRCDHFRIRKAAPGECNCTGR